MQLPFGEWLPDQPKFMNPGANVAKNVYFAARSYKPFPSLTTFFLFLTQPVPPNSGSVDLSSALRYNSVSN